MGGSIQQSITFYYIIVLYFFRWLPYYIFIGNKVIIEKTDLDDDGGCV